MEEIMKTKKLNLFSLVAIAAVLFAGTAGGVYAYWAGSVGAPTAVEKGDSVTVGEADAVTTELTVGAAVGTGTLVPAGQAEAGQVEYVILTHSVLWEEDTTERATGHAGTLGAAVKAGTVKIDGATTHAGLVNITIQVGGTAPVGGVLDTPAPAIYLDGAAVTVYIKVTLTEPADAAVYAAVAGKTITFDVEFSVTVA